MHLSVSLPPATQVRLDLIRELSSDIEEEYDAVIAELVELGVSRLDVARVLGLHHHTPRPLTVTNSELAQHGLERHPDAVGIEWEDHGFALTRTCRRHVDALRRSYRDVEPDGLNALVYPGTRFQCDLCHEGDDL